MERMVSIVSFQVGALFVGVLALLAITIPHTDMNLVTGQAIAQSEDTDIFAPPYSAFSGDNIISLRYDKVDNETFHITAQISIDNGAIYTNIYYYTQSGWQQQKISASNDWIKNSATIQIDELYSNVAQTQGDDFYVGVWICVGVDETWQCGCKDPSDCGYWHIQGIDLAFEGETVTDCIDNDGDGYGSPASQSCFLHQEDCNDNDASSNPGEEEIPYNGIDDDCNASTLDNDLDMDGYVLTDDCDDNDASRYPGQREICGNGVDEDCDGIDMECEQCGEGSITQTGCNCAATPYYTGYCCDNTYQEVACGSPEVIFYDGFESGTANTWDYLNPYSRVNQDSSYNGLYSLDLIYQPGTESLKTDQHASKGFVGQPILYARYYMYVEEDFIHDAQGVIINTFGTAGDWQTTQALRSYQGQGSVGRLWLNIGNGDIDSGVNLQNGRWYCVESMIVVQEDGQDTYTAWVDDAQVYTTTVEYADSYITYYEQGGDNAGVSPESPTHIYIDTVEISKVRIGC